MSAAVFVTAGVALWFALQSPLLAWRRPVYILAGVAGVVALVLLVVQPLLIGGHLSGIGRVRGRNLHRWLGLGLVGAVLVHVIALWITSPPDVVDALLFRSPTPFSVWGVLAMWALFAAAAVALLQRRGSGSPRGWRRWHGGLVTVVVAGSVLHALQIEGTMEPVSKALLCGLAVLALVRVMVDLRHWRLWCRS
ncbi:ferric reductase-like transmembrane domain-containing protein [Shimia sp. SDUM112013]|uniref:ferric reductase-like transmembrane domain-containing protein n=1 Tax=Shimia sp. SDUM112013 TaxID=3136160 RepID=UPI0032EDF501